MIKRSLRGAAWCLLVCVLVCEAQAATGVVAGSAQGGQAAAFRVDYTVQVANIEEQLFHVTADIRNIRQKRLDLSLPTWTPGWYITENYAKNVLRFKVTDAATGARVPFTMTRKQTWTVETDGVAAVRVEFDYRANVLALNQAKITKDYAFFTGTQLFLEAEGHRASASNVRFQVPAGWKIVSALKETGEPFTYTAPDYDTLVDAPTEMGNFDVTRFEVEGKPHFFVATPAGTFSKEKTAEFVRMLTRVALTEGSIFGDLPYEKYVHFYFFQSAESNAAGALEHSNSFVAFAPPGEVALPDRLIGTAAHEFFHLWNVKRIRPAEMWPYDYTRERETPLLWVSEGVTNYYTQVTLYRAGLRTREQFLERAAETISEMQNVEASAHISPASSSVSTWICYDTPCAFQISYYTSGQNLGALLDLSILADTGGASGLDDVMRTLYRDFYGRGRGYTTDDLIGVINRLTKRDYRDFFRRHVSGVEVPRYEEIFGAAGLRLEKTARRVAVIDIGFEPAPDGVRVRYVPPRSPFAAAGIRAGDVLRTVDGLDVSKAGLDIVDRLGERIGRRVPLIVRRADKDVTLEMTVRARDVSDYKLTESPQATPAQLRVREAWLRTNAPAATTTTVAPRTSRNEAYCFHRG